MALLGLLFASLLGGGRAAADEAGDPLRDGPASPPGAPSIVASLGAATVTFPIEVPPGRHGMAPGIALRYNSAAGNGNAGYGFSLALGSIERSTRFGAPHFDATDTFVLVLGDDAIELVPVDAGSTRFRTAIDSGYLVERVSPGPFGAGSFYWVARGPDGRRYRFGFMGGTDNPSQTGNLRWGLDRVEDTSGNVMEIAWNASGLHLFPARIDYASHPVRGLPASNRVEFCWEERGDQTPGPAGDRLTHRLRQIRTFASDQPARAYTFEFDSQGNPTSGLGTCRTDASPVAGPGNPEQPPPGPTPPPRRSPGEGPILEGSRLRPLRVAPEAVAVPPSGLPATNSHLVRVLRGDGTGRSLPPIEYRYTADPNPAWPAPGNAPLPPLPFFYAQSDGDEDAGVRMVDLNRDGRLDIIQIEGRQEGFVWNYSAAAYLNAGDAFAYSASWTAGLLGLVNAADASRSACFVIKRGTRGRVDNGARFLDVNDDGLPDVVRSVLWFGSGLRKSVFLNTGSGFVLDPASAAALPDEPFIDVHADPSRDVSDDKGVRMADVNNDGRADLLVSRAEWGGPSERRTYLYDRGAYRLDPRWMLPDEPFVRHVPHGRTLDMGVRILELNGDGFPDLFRAANVDGFVQTAAYVNTARPDAAVPAWIATTRYGTLGVFADHFVQISSAGDGVSYDRGLRIADIDGDGRSDILAARQWNGGPIERFLYTTSPEGPWTYRVIDLFPWVFVSKPAGGAPRDQGVRIADLDGDGSTDALLSQPGGLRQWRPNRAWQGRLLLTSYSNGLGGMTEIAYVPAPHGGSIEGGFPAALPFPLAVVGAVTTKDGLGHAYTTRYEYDGGFFHHAAREFRGFRRVTALPPGGEQSTETLFVQQPGLRHAPLRGEAEETIVRRSADGAVYSRTAVSFDTSDALPPLRHLPVRSETTLYDWTTSDPLSPAFLKRTAVSWSYRFDEASGLDRVLLQRIERQEGDVEDASDDRLAVVDLVSNLEADLQGAAGPGSWLLEQPWHQSASDADGVVVAESWTSYDGGAQGQPGTRGLQTRIEQRGGQPGPAGDHGPGDPANSVVSRSYDPFGNLTSEVDRLGRERRVEHGLLDGTFTFPDREIDPLGRATERRFDARSGLLSRVVDPNGRATEIEYDSFFRRTAEWGPLDTAAQPTVSYLHDYARVPARVVRYAREQSGQGERAGTNGCLESSAYFDGMGRLVEVTTESASGRIVSRAAAFDAAGRLVSEAEPFASAAGTDMVPPSEASYARTLAYDAAGRIAATTNARGETERQEYQAWTVASIDPMGHRRAVERDAFGQIVRVQEFEGAGDGAVAVPPATYKYDAAGRLVSLTDPEGTTIHLRYDAQGRRTTLEDPHAGTWTYAYDAKGNLVAETDPMGRTTTLRYDALDRLTQKVLADGDTFAWRYDEGGAPMDALGRLTSVADRTGQVRFTHDAMGRVVFSWRSTFGALHGARTTYDAMGRMTSRTLQGNNRADYAYDAGGELAAVLPFIDRITHNERGQTTETVYAGGARVRRDYDPATGRPLGLGVTGPHGERLFEQTSVFDADGLLAMRADLTDPDRPVPQSYLYDGRHRLVEASSPGGTLSYAYDDAGTLTVKEGVAFERDDALHPQWITRTSQGESLSYDAAGNCLAAASPLGQRSMTYDLRGRMIRVSDPHEQLVVSTDYDAEGRAVRETTDRQGVRSVVLWPMREVEVRDGRRTLHHYAGSERIATIDNDGRVFFPILDHLGSARLVLDSQGQVVYRASYRPYGDPVAGGMEDAITGFRFAEARRDGSGLLQMGWRHYDPALGRFLEPDPVLASPFDPQSLNRYAYARDNPVNLTDKDGRSPLTAILFWGALFLLDRSTRQEVGASVALTAASILLTGALGPGPATGFAALKASVPALYAAAASTILLDSALGEGIANSYALLLQDLGVSERGAQGAARLTTAWLLNSSLQRGFGRLQAPLGSVAPGDSLGDSSTVDAALAQRGIDPTRLGNPASDAYGTTLASRTGANGRPTELKEFRTIVDSSGRVVGVYGVRDLGPFFDHGAVGLLGTGAAPAVTQPHFAYAIGGVSTQQVARDLFSAGYSGSLFTLTGRGSDFLIEFVYGPYGGGLAYGLGAARSDSTSGGGP